MGSGLVAVIGASGRTGRLVVSEALRTGHGVRALARRPADALLPVGAEVVSADVRDRASLSGPLSGVDAVISLLGVSRMADARHTDRLFSEGTRKVRSAMTAARVRRLVVVSSSGVVDSPHDDWLYRAVKRLVLSGMYADMRIMETEALADQHLEVAVVRAPRLTDGPAGGRLRLSASGEPPVRRSMSRADLAPLLLDAAETGAHAGRIVSVTG